MKDQKAVSRREFLQRIGALGTAGLAAGSFISACGGGEGEQEGAAENAAASPCADVTGLTDAEKQTRTTLNYVDVSPQPDKRCDNCAYWIKQEGNAPCGGCQIVKGPIDPRGWCTSYVQAQA